MVEICIRLSRDYRTHFNEFGTVNFYFFFLFKIMASDYVANLVKYVKYVAFWVKPIYI